MGVAGDVKFDSLKQDPADSPVVYAAILQTKSIDDMSIVVRTKVDPAQTIPSLRQEISCGQSFDRSFQRRDASRSHAGKFRRCARVCGTARNISR